MTANTTSVVAFPAVAARRAAQPGSKASPGDVVLMSRDKTQRKAVRDASPGALGTSEIWRALVDERVVVHYQPVYDTFSGAIVGAEALARLIDERGELVHPEHFIRHVEGSDLSVMLGRSVVRRACHDLARWRRAGARIPEVSINVSVSQLVADAGYVAFVAGELAANELEFSDLQFELIEREDLFEHRPAVAVLRALSDRGARIAVDGFGSGYSSFVYLSELPVSSVKVSARLIERIDVCASARRVVASLVNFCAQQALTVVAKGVESAEQNTRLREVGCRYGLGYLVAKPMSADELCPLLEQGSPALAEPA